MEIFTNINVHNSDVICPILDDMSLHGIQLQECPVDDSCGMATRERLISELNRYTSRMDAQGILHPRFVYPGTVTNRITCIEPNIIGMSKALRNAVVARKGCVLIDADFHQADIGSVAWLSGDANMQSDYSSGLDFHRVTASRIFNCTPDAVNDHQRQCAKRISLGILYGESAYGIAKNLSIPVDEAQKLIDTFYEAYPSLLAYRDDLIRSAFYAQEAKVSTLFGTEIPVSDMHSIDAEKRFKAYRQCLNYAAQGTTADVFLRALVALFDALKAYDAHILVVAYDEFLVEAPASCTYEVSQVIHDIMAEAALPIVMSVDVQVGHTWKEVH